MFLEHVAARGTMTGDTAADALVLTTTGDMPAGEIAVLRLSMTTTAILTTADSAHVVTVVDSAGNVWTKIGERTRQGLNPSTYEKATIVALWFAHLTVPLPAGSTITAACDAQYQAYCLAVNAFSMEVPEATVTVAGVGTASGKSNPTTVSVACTPAAGGDDYTWLLALATNANPGDTLNLSGSYTTDRPKIGSQPDFFRRTVLAGQHRALNVETQTWSGSVTGSDVLWAAVLGALAITLPTPPIPPAGTREFQPDFETPTHQTDRTSTGLRPDAITPDYRVVTSMGPAAIGDVAAGVHTHIWKARAEPGAIWLARETDAKNAWQAETLFTTYTGVDIDELGFCFTVDGYPVFALQRNTQIGGGPTVSVIHYSPTVPGYVETIFGAGRSPRCVSDYFPTTVSPDVCPPETDVQVFWLKTGVGLKRREQRDNYGTDYPTVLGNSSFTQLQQAFRTTDRRVSLVYTQRNVVTGRYLLRRLDSKQYNDSLLRRPNFINTNGLATDLMVFGTQAWRTGSVTTQDWYLRCETQDDADAIEVGASAAYPVGTNPVFDQQEQVLSVSNAGDYADAVFSITHGLGSMSLVAFRARTRKTVGELTCYSPWRYTVIPAEWPLTGAVGDFSASCARDLMVDVPTRLGWIDHGLVEGVRTTSASARNDPYSFTGDPCTSGTAYTEASTAPTGSHPGWFFVGGTRNTSPSFPNPTHFQEWAVRRRAWAPINFTDPDGRYVGRVIGPVAQSWAGSGTDPFTWSADLFPRQFPNDQGAFPVEPLTLQIVGLV